MIAWKRILFMAGSWLAVSAGLAGCASSAGPKNSDGKPISQVQENTAPSPVPELPEPEILPQTHMSAGLLHESQNNLARAVQQYRLAVAAQPTYVEAYNRLGMVLDRLMRFKEADEAFQKAIQLAPRQAHLHNNLGFSYTMQSRWPEAEAALRRAVEITPEFVRARVNLAMVMAQQGRFDEARLQFLAGLTKADAYYNMGLMYQSKSMIREAAQAYKTALSFNSDMVAARNRLATFPEDIVRSAEAGEIEQASPTAPEVAALGVIEQAPRQDLTPATQPGAAVAAPAPDVVATAATAEEPVLEAQQADEATVEEPVIEAQEADVATEQAPALEAQQAEVTTVAPEPEAAVDAEPAAEIEAAVEPEEMIIPVKVRAESPSPAAPADESLMHSDRSGGLPFDLAQARVPVEPQAPEEAVVLSEAAPIDETIETSAAASQPAEAAPATQPEVSAGPPSRMTLDVMQQALTPMAFEPCWEVYAFDRLPERPQAAPPLLDAVDASNEQDNRQSWANAPERIRQVLNAMREPFGRVFNTPPDHAVLQEKVNSPAPREVPQPQQSGSSARPTVSLTP